MIRQIRMPSVFCSTGAAGGDCLLRAVATEVRGVGDCEARKLRRTPGLVVAESMCSTIRSMTFYVCVYIYMCVRVNIYIIIGVFMCVFCHLPL